MADLYRIWPEVLEGMDVVDKSLPPKQTTSQKDIKIEKIEIIKDYDFSK